MKLLSAFLLAVFVFILISGIAVFTAFAFDYYHMGEPLTLSAISEFFNAKSSATEVVENFDAQNMTRPAVSTAAERVLNIWETSTEKEPLANVSFAIYKVCSSDELFSGAVKLNTIPSEDDIDTYSTAERLVETITTDRNGYATYSFGYGENDGVYMVSQLVNHVVTETTKPFFISFPMTNIDGTDFLYTINVYPKNDIEFTVPIVNKDVSNIDNKLDSFDYNTEQIWIIRTSVPNDIRYSEEYSIIDKMEENLTFVDGSVSVVLALKTEKAYNEKNHALIEDEDYFLSMDKTGDSSSVKISFTKNGRIKIAEGIETKYSDYEIRIYLKTKIQTNVPAGTMIRNDAEIIYRNSVGQEFVSEAEKKPGVVNGGLNILKIDSKNEKKLSGATFKIARVATTDEIDKGSYENIYIEKDNTTEKVKVVFVEFFDNSKLSGKRVKSVTTDNHGNAYMYGLTYGDYYLVETKAPDGYVILDKAVPVVVNSYTHIEGNYIKVINVRKSILPSTGDSGAILVYILILAFVLSAAVFILTNKKKRAV